MYPNSYFNIDLLASLNEDLESNLFEIEFSEETASFKETSEKVDSGVIYKQVVECIISKDYTTRNGQFNSITTDKAIVFAFDQNNLCHVLGIVNIDGSSSGAEVNVSSDTGSTLDSLNHRKLIITCESPYPSPSLGTLANEFFEIANPEDIV